MSESLLGSRRGFLRGFGFRGGERVLDGRLHLPVFPLAAPPGGDPEPESDEEGGQEDAAHDLRDEDGRGDFHLGEEEPPGTDGEDDGKDEAFKAVHESDVTFPAHPEKV